MIAQLRDKTGGIRGLGKVEKIYLDNTNLIYTLAPDNAGIGNAGLAPIHAPKGTIIAFSTSPGETAMDYGAGRNSIYTGSFPAPFLLCSSR